MRVSARQAQAEEKLGPALPEWGSIGVIQELKPAGIGFIRPHSGKVDDKDLFFHKSALKNGGLLLRATGKMALTCFNMLQQEESGDHPREIHGETS